MTILFILVTILLFGALIATHEFGHFVTAKTPGVRAEKFTIGTGPKLLSRTRGETAYSLRVLPVGGFCSMEGEEEASDNPRSFSGEPAQKEFIILVVRTFLSFVTGLMILLVLFSAARSPSAPVISGYLPRAEDIRGAGLLPGNEFYRIDEHRIYFQSDAILFLGRAGGDMVIEVFRDDRWLDLGTLHLPYRTLTDGSGQQSLERGVMVGGLQEAEPLNTLCSAWYQSVDYMRTVWLNLGDLIRGAVGLSGMAGPISIFAMAGEVGQQGAAATRMAGALLNILSFVALIAISLAMINLLPIPALDGGRILSLLTGGIYHFLARRRIGQKYLGYINMAGFFCLIALMVAVAVNDVNKLVL